MRIARAVRLVGLCRFRPQITDHSSQFNIGDPVYSASFLITPGIDARLSLNIAVWRHSWDWFLWLPRRKR